MALGYRQGATTGGAGSRKVALVVLGMHRSGTSAAARLLSLLGARLPRNLMRPLPGVNDRGFWESMEVQGINDEVFASAGSSWDDPRQIPPAWFASADAERFRPSLIEVLSREFEDSALFVLKDPRICRLLPLWKPALREFGADSRFIQIFRNPLDVSSSLKARDGFETQKSLLLWLRYVLKAEEETRGQPRVFHSFDGLLKDWGNVVDKITAELGVQWPRPIDEAKEEIDRFLVPEQRHHREDPVTTREKVPGVVYRVYQALQALADSAAEDELTAGIDELGRISTHLAEFEALYTSTMILRPAHGRSLDESAGKAMENLRAENRDLRDEIGHLVGQLRSKDFELSRRDRELQGLDQRVAELATVQRSAKRELVRLFHQARSIGVRTQSEDGE